MLDYKKSKDIEIAIAASEGNRVRMIAIGGVNSEQSIRGTENTSPLEDIGSSPKHPTNLVPPLKAHRKIADALYKVDWTKVVTIYNRKTIIIGDIKVRGISEVCSMKILVSSGDKDVF